MFTSQVQWVTVTNVVRRVEQLRVSARTTKTENGLRDPLVRTLQLSLRRKPLAKSPQSPQQTGEHAAKKKHGSHGALRRRKKREKQHQQTGGFALHLEKKKRVKTRWPTAAHYRTLSPLAAVALTDILHFAGGQISRRSGAVPQDVSSGGGAGGLLLASSQPLAGLISRVGQEC